MRRNYSNYLNTFQETYGVNNSTIAEAIGATNQAVSHWRVGRHTPSQPFRDRLNRFILNYKKEYEPMTIFAQQETQAEVIALDSRTVAEWTNKKHKELMRDIRQYSEYLKGADLRCTDFWQETTYTASNGKENPCYMITKKGCEFIQHKMTGQKGSVFTAKYINYFWDQGEQLQEATQILLDLENQPANQALPGISDLSYIKNKLAELVDMDSLSDISNGLERVKRLVEVIGGTP